MPTDPDPSDDEQVELSNETTVTQHPVGDTYIKVSDAGGSSIILSIGDIAELAEAVGVAANVDDAKIEEHEHIVTAREPAWVETKHAYDDEDGILTGESTVTSAVDGYFDESTYECSCGATLSGWYEVELHLENPDPPA